MILNSQNKSNTKNLWKEKLAFLPEINKADFDLLFSSTFIELVLLTLVQKNKRGSNLRRALKLVGFRWYCRLGKTIFNILKSEKKNSDNDKSLDSMVLVKLGYQHLIF